MVNRRREVAAFTLFEVILALAILAGAVALIGEALRFGMRNAQIARNSTHAQFLCESKLSELVAQVTPLESISGAVFETDPDWVYSVEFETIDDNGLLAVYVTVAPIDAPTGSRDEFMLVRWMRDPNVVLAEEEEALLNAESASSSSGTGQSSSSSAAGGLR